MWQFDTTRRRCGAIKTMDKLIQKSKIPSDQGPKALLALEQSVFFCTM